MYGLNHWPFTNWESYGHFVQGSLFFFLFTAGFWNPYHYLLGYTCHILYSLASIYPLYNLIKRGILSTSTFADSSWTNNELEWCLGVLMSILMGKGCARYHRVVGISCHQEVYLRRLHLSLALLYVLVYCASYIWVTVTRKADQEVFWIIPLCWNIISGVLLHMYNTKWQDMFDSYLLPS